MLLTLLASSILAPAPTELALKGNDPIELAQGNETQGKPEFSFDYLRHRYQFSSAENLQRFTSDPASHAIQQGGACGKMGVLTGKGSPDRYAVVDGKIWVFASDGCRETFLKNKDLYFEKREVPSATSQERRIARELLAKVIEAHGGQEAVDSISRAEFTFETPYMDEGVKKTWIEKRVIETKDQAIAETSGNSFFVISQKGTSEGYAHEHFEIHPEEVRALRASYLRTALGILKEGQHLALKAGAEGANKTVTYAQGDIVTTVILNGDMRITGVRYRDTYAGPFRNVERSFTGYEKVQGVWLPASTWTRIDGGKLAGPRSAASIIVNGPRNSVFEEAFR